MPFPTTSSPDISSRRALAALAALVLGAAVLRLLLFRGYVGLDDGEYALMAHQLAEGRFHPTAYAGPPVFPLRIGLIAPAALSFQLFGFGEWQSVVYPFVTSLLALVLAYWFTATLFGPIAGLAAASVLALAPQDVEMASKLLPDQPGAFLMAAGVAIAIHLARGSERSPQALFAGGFFAGLLFGASWLHKESVAYVAPFMLLLLIMSWRESGRRVLPLWGGVALASAGVLLAEMVVYWRLTGDALFRVHEVERNYTVLENGFFTEGSDFGWQAGESYMAAILRRVFVTGPEFLLLNPAFSYLPLVGVVAAAWALRARDRAFLMPSLWLLSLLAMFNFGSSSTTSYMPLALFHRYIYPLALPAAVLFGGLVARQVPALTAAWRDRRIPYRAWPAVAASGLILASAAWEHQYPLRHRDEVRAWTAEVRELSDEITPDTRLYSDTLSLRGLDFYSGHHQGDTRWVDFERLPVGQPPESGSLVLVNLVYIDWLQVNRGMWLSDVEGYVVHDFYSNPPGNWTRVRDFGPAALYRVESAPPAE